MNNLKEQILTSKDNLSVVFSEEKQLKIYRKTCSVYGIPSDEIIKYLDNRIKQSPNLLNVYAYNVIKTEKNDQKNVDSQKNESQKLEKVAIEYEYYETNLKDLFRQSMKSRKAFPEKRIINIFKQTLKGIQHLHSKNLVQGDIRMNNIVQCYSQNNKIIYKLTDQFASSIQPNQSIQQNFCKNIEQLKLTQSFLAPEQLKIIRQNTSSEQIKLKEKMQTKENDLWGLGVIFLELALLENVHFKLYDWSSYSIDFQYLKQKLEKLNVSKYKYIYQILNTLFSITPQNRCKVYKQVKELDIKMKSSLRSSQALSCYEKNKKNAYSSLSSSTNYINSINETQLLDQKESYCSKSSAHTTDYQKGHEDILKKPAYDSINLQRSIQTQPDMISDQDEYIPFNCSNQSILQLTDNSIIGGNEQRNSQYTPNQSKFTLPYNQQTPFSNNNFMQQQQTNFNQSEQFTENSIIQQDFSPFLRKTFFQPFFNNNNESTYQILNMTDSVSCENQNQNQNQNVGNKTQIDNQKHQNLMENCQKLIDKFCFLDRKIDEQHQKIDNALLNTYDSLIKYQNHKYQQEIQNQVYFNNYNQNICIDTLSSNNINNNNQCSQEFNSQDQQDLVNFCQSPKIQESQQLIWNKYQLQCQQSQDVYSQVIIEEVEDDSFQDQKEEEQKDKQEDFLYNNQYQQQQIKQNMENQEAEKQLYNDIESGDSVNMYGVFEEEDNILYHQISQSKFDNYASE